jgi:transcriptional regulator with XRE-family HTH domain
MEEKDLCQEISSAEEIHRHFIEFIKILQKTMKLSVDKQKDLVKISGVNASTISNLIKHGTVPTSENLYKILYAYLGRPPIDLTLPLKTNPIKKLFPKLNQSYHPLPKIQFPSLKKFLDRKKFRD